MSLREKIEKYRQDYESAVAELDKKYHERQQKAVLDEFDNTSEQLAERVQLQEGSSARDIKTHLKRLKDQYKDTPADLKEMLEAPIAQLEQKYEKQKLAEAQAKEHLHVALIWNDANKELLLPVRWENRLNNDSPQEHSLTEKLYFAAAKAVFEKDPDCTEAEWKGYVSIVAPNYNTVLMPGLEQGILDEIGPELENANITLKVIYAEIKRAERAEEKPETAEEPETPAIELTTPNIPETEAEHAEEAESEDPLENIVNKYKCIGTKETAERLHITAPAVFFKVQKDQLHAFKYKGQWQIPEHDLCTYLVSHKRTNSGKYRTMASELDDAGLKDYIKKVGMVHNVREAAAKLGESQKKVVEMLEENTLHGVKHDLNWLVSDKEIEFFKEAGKYVYDE